MLLGLWDPQGPTRGRCTAFLNPLVFCSKLESAKSRTRASRNCFAGERSWDITALIFVSSTWNGSTLIYRLFSESQARFFSVSSSSSSHAKRCRRMFKRHGSGRSGIEQASVCTSDISSSGNMVVDGCNCSLCSDSDKSTKSEYRNARSVARNPPRFPC